MPRAREVTDPTAEHLMAAHQRVHHEKQEIDRAMQTDPSDPTLLERIEKLTAEVESTDRAVLQRLNRKAAEAFGTPPSGQETLPLWRRLWRRDDRPKRPRSTGTARMPRSRTKLVRVGVLLLVAAGLIYAVAGSHHTS